MGHVVDLTPIVILANVQLELVLVMDHRPLLVQFQLVTVIASQVGVAKDLVKDLLEHVVPSREIAMIPVMETVNVGRQMAHGSNH